MKTVFYASLLVFIAFCSGQAQPVSEPPSSYILPEILEKNDGNPVDSEKAWTEQRRPEILALFRAHVYGTTPEEQLPVSYINMGEDKTALGGKATQKQIRIQFKNDSTQYIDLLVYLPAHQSGPVPLFLGLNFAGNQTIHSDPNIHISDKWVPSWKDPGIVDNRSNEESRGTRTRRWPIERILARGYGLATFYCGDVFLDRKDGAATSIQQLFAGESIQTSEKYSWGAIGAWAWGLSRAMDYLETDASVDSKRVVVMGHSRLGKASLWAGAQDQRFAMVVSNDSGEGGAALSRRKYGERISDLNKSFPHWFAQSFKQYDHKENLLPVDFHMLLAMVAPRPLYVASASEDQWADPTGEYLSAFYTGPVYRLLGYASKLGKEPPMRMSPVGLPGRVGYHMRSGKHDILAYDWDQYMNFADFHLNNKP